MESKVRFNGLYLVVGLVCFAVLGALSGRHVGGPLPIAAFAAGCALLALVVLILLGGVLNLVSRSARKQHGAGAVWGAVARGYLMMIPFTVLAALAELYLGWSAAQAFTAAGVMTAGAAAGAEAIKLGGGRVRSLVVSSGGALLLSGLWMFLSATALTLGR